MMKTHQNIFQIFIMERYILTPDIFLTKLIRQDLDYQGNSTDLCASKATYILKTNNYYGIQSYCL